MKTSRIFFPGIAVSPISRPRLAASARGWIAPLLLGAAFALFLALVQFSTPNMPDNDGFYHIKLAYLMRTEGLTPEFPWLPLSILNARDYYDHHFLFHVALIPFTFGSLVTGAKAAAVTFAALAFLGVWYLLNNQRVPYAALWALGLAAVSEAFIFRMSITRAQSLSLLVLMVAFDALLRRKHRRLAVLAFVYVWLYNAFPLMIVLAGAVVAARWAIDRKLDLRPLLIAGAGVALGLLINPYFPHNIVFAYLHILPKLVETTAVSVGNEWYPYDTGQLLRNSPLALAVFVAGAGALGLSGRRMDARTAAAFLLAALFGLMLFQSRRFIEYFPPFALVFAAFAFAPLLEARPTGLFVRPAGGFLRRQGRTVRYVGLLVRRHLPAVLLALVLIPGAWMTLRDAQASIGRSKDANTYAGASAWLVQNTPAGSRVFQTDWDDFPRLFFYNTHNTYLIGLDPTYLSLYDAGLYDLWVAVTKGSVERPSAAIAGDFGAQYVHTDLQHGGFLRQAADDPGLVEVYRDGDSVIFQVVRDGSAR